MKIIAQPESYSDMLERVFATTVVTGVICTLIVTSASPDAKALLDSVKTEAEIGPVRGLKALYVLVPIAIGVISRIIRLHDKISDLLQIRFRFDTQYILFPLAQLSGHTLDNGLKQHIRSVRQDAMYKVFYPYVDSAEPKIDRQLVRTALDNWGWFWGGIECECLFIVTAIIVKVIGGDGQFWICLDVSLVIGLLLFITWFACRRSADRQIRAIIDDLTRKADIHAYFATVRKNLNN